MVLVEVGDAQKDLDDVEARDFFVEPFVALDESEKFASCAVLDDKDKKLVGFKSILHLDEEGMGGILHDIPLIHDDVLLLVLYDHLLVDHLHSVELPVLLEPAQEHLRKPSRPNQLQHLEVL